MISSRGRAISRYRRLADGAKAAYLRRRGIADRWQSANVQFAMRQGGLIRTRQARVAARTFKATGLVIGGTGGVIGLAIVHGDNPAIRATGIGIAIAAGAAHSSAFG